MVKNNFGVLVSRRWSGILVKSTCGRYMGGARFAGDSVGDENAFGCSWIVFYRGR